MLPQHKGLGGELWRVRASRGKVASLPFCLFVFFAFVLYVWYCIVLQFSCICHHQMSAQSDQPSAGKNLRVWGHLQVLNHPPFSLLQKMKISMTNTIMILIFMSLQKRSNAGIQHHGNHLHHGRLPYAWGCHFFWPWRRWYHNHITSSNLISSYNPIISILIFWYERKGRLLISKATHGRSSLAS